MFSPMTTLLAAGAPLLLLVYYIAVFTGLKRDPTPRVVVPQYQPPGGLSPAHIRFLWRGVSDARTVAAVFAHLCSLRLIALQKEGNHYSVSRLYSQKTPLPNLSHDENVVLDFLFANFYDTTKFDPARQSPGCASVIQAVLAKSINARYVKSNARYAAIGVLISCLTAIALLSMSPGTSQLLDYVVTSGFIAAVALFGPILVQTVMPVIRDLANRVWKFGRIFLVLVLASFFALWFLVVATHLQHNHPTSTGTAILILALINLIAQPLLRRDTEEGKKLKYQIEGFREFLCAVEQDQLQRMNLPKKQIEFVGHLAYAIALEVKEGWGDDLSNDLFPSLG
jgi:hypothetical protein